MGEASARCVHFPEENVIIQDGPYPIRETPVPSALRTANSSVPGVNPLVGEPRLAPENIQGSILTGFNKSHRILLFLSVDRARIGGFKIWLKNQILFVATSDEVIAFNRLFKRAGRRGSDR